MTAYRAGKGECTGVKDFHSTVLVPKTVSGSSVVIKPTMMEVGWDDQQGQGGRFGKDGK